MCGVLALHFSQIDPLFSVVAVMNPTDYMPTAKYVSCDIILGCVCLAESDQYRYGI